MGPGVGETMFASDCPARAERHFFLDTDGANSYLRKRFRYIIRNRFVYCPIARTETNQSLEFFLSLWSMS